MNEDDIEKIEKVLPKGSGINGQWEILVLATGRTAYASNIFGAIGNQSYCHDYEFRVSIQFQYGRYIMTHFDFKGQLEHPCCGLGLANYLEETICEALEENQREK